MVIVLSACDKEFLEKSPIVGTTEENFYRNEADAIAAVNAAYASLQFQLSPAGHFRWFWGDIMSDDAEKGGGSDNDRKSGSAGMPRPISEGAHSGGSKVYPGMELL